MKTKTLALLLSLALLLTACASPAAKPTAPTYPQSAQMDGEHIRIGKYHAEMPDTFEVYESSETSIILISRELHCIIGLFATDVSNISEDELRPWMEGLAPSAYGARETETSFSDMSLSGHLWVELDDDLEPIANIQTNFTDSWYMYQLTTKLMPGSDETDAMRESIIFLKSFVADDVPSRFDFVQ